MYVLNEERVRLLHQQGQGPEFAMDAETYVTQGAKDYMEKNGLSLSNQICGGTGDQPVKVKWERPETKAEISGRLAAIKINSDIRPARKAKESGGSERVREKAEHETHLYGTTLVSKDHPRIALRGKLDSFEAQIIEAQVSLCKEWEGLVRDLDEILSAARKILACEVTGKPLGEFYIFGLCEQELRKQSQNPKEALGIGHMLPSYEYGPAFSRLNMLRTVAREAELAAVLAFRQGNRMERTDLILGLNRMSSAVYLLMCRYLAGYYER